MYIYIYIYTTPGQSRKFDQTRPSGSARRGLVKWRNPWPFFKNIQRSPLINQMGHASRLRPRKPTAGQSNAGQPKVFGHETQPPGHRPPHPCARAQKDGEKTLAKEHKANSHNWAWRLKKTLDAVRSIEDGGVDSLPRCVPAYLP